MITTTATECEVLWRDAVERTPSWRFGVVFGERVDDAEQTSDEQLLRRMADAEALITQLRTQQGRDLLQLRERRLDSQRAESPDGHYADACTRGCCDPDGWMGLEVAQALAVTERQVDARLDTAEQASRFHHVRRAAADGRLQSWTTTKLLEHLAELATLVPADRLEGIERVTLGWLLERPRTVGQLNARMRRLIVGARDDAGDDQPRRDARDRSVRVTPVGSDGLAALVARLPEADALAVRAVLAALAADPVAADDSRTVEQRRCDLVTTLITGMPAAYGHHGDVDLMVRGLGDLDVHVDVTIAADAMTGGATPAEVPGYGAIPATTACDLASRASSYRPLVYHPDDGRLLGLGDLLRAGTCSGASGDVRIRWLDTSPAAAGYAHPPVMERLVQRRDVTCRAPGCARRAERCDCDHVTPYPRGQTSASNTCCLCRRHHRLKTHAPGWTTTLDSEGRLTWTTPTGRTIATDAHDYRQPGVEPPAFGPTPF